MENQVPKFLTQEQAELRTSQLEQGSISYKLHLRYDEGKTFAGLVEVQFKVTDLRGSDVLLDFQGKIQSLYINQQVVEQVNYDGLFIRLPQSVLKIGENSVLVRYNNNYANDGNGLHSFVDTDEKQYLYSQCEAYFCNKVFPSFDQPDLKTTVALQVYGPSQWTVLFNTNEDNNALNDSSIEGYQELQQEFKSTVPQGHVHRIFPKTLPISTYLFGFIAGPFKKIENTKFQYDNIPMNIYCRESLYEHTLKLSDFIFESTKECMAFYESFFGYKFAFPKYDQIFCPEFNCGAMENAGLVTFNDRYIFKEDVDSSKLTNFCNTITHELSHHWFGNLVTMKWWNDLWLNESFADFISHFAIANMKFTTRETADPWVIFNNRKSWGYNTDQLETTHPIAGEVKNTEEAESIFDGITYSKGSSTLRQLLSLMGEDKFSKALKKYFATYAFKNATLQDFINTLNEEFNGEQYGLNLQQWEQMWIRTAGLNQVQADFDPSSTSPNSQLRIAQGFALAQHNTLRTHNIDIAFIKENGDIDRKNVLILPQAETVVEYDGSQQYKAILLNYNDYAFLKLAFDKSSIEYFKTSLHKIKDVLARVMIWRVFYDMLRDGLLSSEDYITIFINSMVNETAKEIISNQFSYVTIALNGMTPSKYRSVLADRLFEFALQMLKTVDRSQTDKFVNIRDSVVSFAQSDAAKQRVLDWYYKTDNELKDVELGNSNQWKIIRKVYRSDKYPLEQKEKLLQEQIAIDKSDISSNMQFELRAILAGEEERQRLFALYNEKGQSELSLRQMEYSLDGFNYQGISDKLDSYYEQWYNGLEEYATKFSKDQLQGYFYGMLPCNDSKLEEWRDKLEAKVGQLHEDKAFLKKLVRTQVDQLKRKIKNYQCFQNTAPLAQQQN